MRLANVRKYNIFIRIPGLKDTSIKLAGKGLYLRNDGALVDHRSVGKLKGRNRVFKRTGKKLWRTGKFPVLSRIEFSNDPAKVREFIRLVVRTRATVLEAASATGIEIEDLSRYQPQL